MDQLYTPKPDVPESEIIQGLLCVTKWHNRWVRALVSIKLFLLDDEIN